MTCPDSSKDFPTLPHAVPFQLHKTTGWPKLATQSVDHILMVRFGMFFGKTLDVCSSPSQGAYKTKNLHYMTLSRARGRKSNSSLYTLYIWSFLESCCARCHGYCGGLAKNNCVCNMFTSRNLWWDPGQWWLI